MEARPGEREHDKDGGAQRRQPAAQPGAASRERITATSEPTLLSSAAFLAVQSARAMGVPLSSSA